MFPLYLDIVPPECKKDVLEHLVEDVRRRGYHITTGNICTKYIYEVLAQNGYIEDAYQMIKLKQQQMFLYSDSEIKWRLDWDSSSLYTAIESCDLKAVERQIQELFDFLYTKQPSILLVQSIISQIAAFLTTQSEKYGYNLKEPCADLITKTLHITEENSLRSIHEQLQSLCNIVCNLIVTENASALLIDRIPEIVEYVKQNYQKPLSLRSLAEVYHINHIYLGQLFFKSTGEYFNSFLNRIRIEKSILLLENTDLSINDVAFKVGYTNPVSYYRNFKNIMGINPGDFKENILKKTND